MRRPSTSDLGRGRPEQYDPVMHVQWPLIGRDEELAAVQDAMEAPGVSGLVLAGAAGVGKTRLAREVLARAEERGMMARWAVATQTASAIPFGALAQLLPQLDERRPDHVQLLRWAAAALQEGVDSRRLILGVDDAQLLDGTSAALVHQLAATSAALVVVTIRSGEPISDAITALWKDGLAARLELQPLSYPEVEELIGAVLGGQIDGLTLHRLWTATQGNPLLLRERVLAGLELGELKRRDDVWRWSGPFGVSPRLTDLIDARLDRLEGPQRAILELLAAGEPLGPSGPGPAHWPWRDGST